MKGIRALRGFSDVLFRCQGVINMPGDRRIHNFPVVTVSNPLATTRHRALGFQAELFFSVFFKQVKVFNTYIHESTFSKRSVPQNSPKPKTQTTNSWGLDVRVLITSWEGILYISEKLRSKDHTDANPSC